LIDHIWAKKLFDEKNKKERAWRLANINQGGRSDQLCDYKKGEMIMMSIHELWRTKESSIGIEKEKKTEGYR